MNKYGKVFIVGAGPGDPDLITVKALKALQQAEIILYDRLANKELLSCAPPGVVSIYCGKVPGAHAMQQEHINEALVQYAKQGKTVVRLKGGDPFVFGRGSEEAAALAEENIPFEIVPGVTSAIGAAAASGIPLTHRGSAASFACITGSRCHNARSPIRWDLLAHSVDTLAIYMGVSQLPFIREELMKHGKSPSTPAALIENGTTARQRTIVTTLDDMHNSATISRLDNPALIIIGEVVNVRAQLQYAACRAAASLIS
ncbi:uroporphyrinogen-III C-methyltransferase [Paenibacillus oryzae]|uniref:Uroporphyrinogen-III C-methyltransferase n=1 Tax=Paenibacillus oryzae TaxID=1844972 RepID=A0A1A5YQR4_9BACL|nr:uroporphyrinogen-III C-methyltransferase [Paenibacillus oryzae]OBR67962.1 uroporphyrinogen-III C-methyltransferase [Paenibacillus oryzae]